MGRLLVFVCLFLGGCGGCGDDSKVGRLPDAPPPPDGAVDAMVDASIDAMIDAAVDAPIDTPPPLTVRLTIARNGSPALAVQVYFQNADNSLVKSVKTDNNGEAEAVMDAGGSVTAINPFTTPPPVTGRPAPDELRTFVGVKPGDHLFLTLNDPPGTGSVDVTVPNAESANRYEVNTTCGSGTVRPELANLQLASVTGAVSFALGCTTADFLVFAHGFSESDFPIDAFSQSDVDLSGVSVDLSADEYTGLTEVTYNYSHVPGGVGEIDALHYLVSKNGNMYVEPYGSSIVISDSSPPGSLVEPKVTDARLGIFTSSLTRNAPHSIIVSGPNTDQYDVDMDNLLPDVTTPLTYNTTLQQVQWTEDGIGAAPDLSVAAFRVDRSFSESSRSWEWVIAAPHVSGSLQLPAVPNDINDFMPAPDDVITFEDFFNAKVTLTSPVAAGFDAVRAHILEIEEPMIADPFDVPPFGTRTALVTGVTGQVVLVGPGPPPPPTVVPRASSKAGKIRALLMSSKAKAKPAPASSKAKGKAVPVSTKALKAAKARRAVR